MTLWWNYPGAVSCLVIYGKPACPEFFFLCIKEQTKQQRTERTRTNKTNRHTHEDNTPTTGTTKKNQQHSSQSSPLCWGSCGPKEFSYGESPSMLCAAWPKPCHLSTTTQRTNKPNEHEPTKRNPQTTQLHNAAHSPYWNARITQPTPRNPCAMEGQAKKCNVSNSAPPAAWGRFAL